MPVLPKETVLSIFWILRIIGPISEEGEAGFPALESYLARPLRQRANKESTHMKRLSTSWFVVLLFVGLTGCAAHRVPDINGYVDGSGAPAAGNGVCCDRSDGFFHPGPASCPSCACHGGCPCRGAAAGQEVAPGGPPVGMVTYPYYTVRGPRDFLARNPPSIGP
jgi:hypothetical protein